MSDCAKPDDHSQAAAGNETEHRPAREAGRALLAGVLGGLASAAGYVVYSRLPEEQKDRLHRQVRTVIEARVNEIRSSLNL
jgi:hypothetical protein